MQEKFEKLKKYLNKLNEQGLCLAFSGGIDSALLLYLCRGMDILAVTFNSGFQTEDEIKFASDFCRKYDVRQIVLNIDIFQNKDIIKNPKNRCYICKRMFLEEIIKTARQHGKAHIIDGTNFDDLGTYRPGLKALEELGVISPFAEFKINKKEIREFAKESGVEIFDKPSSPCLATRLPYNTIITKEKLDKIQKGEAVLKNFGFETCRFRLHKDIARVEILPEKFEDFLNKRDEILAELKGLNIPYITLDIKGFGNTGMDI